MTRKAKLETLKKLVQKAKEECFTDRQIKSYKNRLVKLSSNFLSGKISAKELKQLYSEIERKAFSIHLTAKKDLHQALVLSGFSKQQAKKISEHEASHFSAAKKFGMKAYYALRFSKASRSAQKITCHPSVIINWKDFIKDHHLRDMIKNIAKAPKVLSRHDKKIT